MVFLGSFTSQEEAHKNNTTNKEAFKLGQKSRRRKKNFRPPLGQWNQSPLLAMIGHRLECAAPDFGFSFSLSLPLSGPPYSLSDLTEA